ncbi:MAG: DUF3822 family protein [Bacteroidales bacterium]|jgi:hypothetical protein|nr:DUF3822 family protein [Bacteroidales bacterium]
MRKLFIIDNTKSIRFSPNGFALLNGKSLLLPPERLIIVDYLPPLLIPQNLYDKTKNFDYVRLQYVVNNSIEIMTEPLEAYSLLFFLPVHDFYTVKSSVEIPVFTHQSTYLYQMAAQDPELADTADFIQLFIDSAFMDVILKKGGELRLINRFNWALHDDMSYYLFNLLKQFELNPHTCKLLLYDEQGTYTSQLAQLWQPYFRYVKCNIL